MRVSKSKAILGLLVVVLCFSCFFTGCSVKNNQKKFDSQDDVISDDSNIEFLDIDSAKIKELYDYIPSYVNLSYKFTAYRDSIVTIDVINNSYLLSTSFRSIESSISDSDKVPYKTVDGEFLDSESLDWYGFDADILRTQVMKMYGRNLADEDFNVGYGASCYYNVADDKYYYSYGGGGPIYGHSIREIDKAYLISDDIVIEDRYMYLFKDYEVSEYALYKSSDMVVKIVDLNENLDDLQTLDTFLIKEYRDSMNGYKHIFKKGSDGEYYWFSTEPIVK